MSRTLITDRPFDAAQTDLLRILSGLIIPASEDYQVPGADDDTIFAEVLRQATSHAGTLKPLLATLSDQAQTNLGGAFEQLSSTQQAELLGRSGNVPLLKHMISLIAVAYYQDGRVLASLNLKSTPPFPNGHDVDQGDWSLLDPVRQREPFYKKP